MDTIFTLKDETDLSEKLNLDDLYEKKKQHDLNTLSIYNKILTRVHDKIRLASRQSKDNQHCWFLIPEIIIGVPKYDNGACIAYIIDKLNSNGFVVKYTHPNLLFISWKHWIPSYVRNEIKKKTGVVIDGNGNRLDNSGDKLELIETSDPNSLLFPKGIKNTSEESKKNFKDVNSYKPTGSLVYNNDLFKKLEDKLS
jgi:hypothetical protein